MKRKASTMSPNVGNFVQDLVHMAQATERLPVVEAELERAQTQIEEYAKQVQRLEMRLIDRSGEIDTLHNAVREAEQGRDAAETMFLECDDKLSAFRRLASSFGSDIASLLKAQEPPAPVAVPVEEQVPGVNEPHPFKDHGGGMSQPIPMPPADLEVHEDPYNLHQGQREADPTASSMTIPSSDVPITSVETPASVPISTSVDKPYHGKLYIYHPGWVSREDWLAGGGDDATYDWREGHDLPPYFYRAANTIYYDPIEF